MMSKSYKDAIEKIPTDNNYVESLTDEKLLCALKQEPPKMGFKQTFFSLDVIPNDLLQKYRRLASF